MTEEKKKKRGRPRNKFPIGNQYGVTSGGGAPVKSEGPDILWDVKKLNIIGYERLCCAVIVQAAKDRDWKFFQSEAIKLYLTDRINPLALLKQIKDNYVRFGRWSAIDTKAEGWLSKSKEEY